MTEDLIIIQNLETYYSKVKEITKQAIVTKRKKIKNMLSMTKSSFDKEYTKLQDLGERTFWNLSDLNDDTKEIQVLEKKEFEIMNLLLNTSFEVKNIFKK